MIDRRFGWVVALGVASCLTSSGRLAGADRRPAKGSTKAEAPAEPWLSAPFAADPAAVIAAAAALSGKDESGARILLEEARYSYDAEGRRSVARRYVLKIVKPEGLDEYGTIEAAYKPERDEVPLLRARVIQEDGRVAVLDPVTVVERPARSDPDWFDDRRLRSAPLPGLAVGSIVEWETVEKERLIFPGGSLGRFYLGGVRPAHRYRLEVDAPRGLGFSWKGFGLANAAPKVTLKGDAVSRVWETVAPREISDFESNTPPGVAQVPYVEFSTGLAWKTIADWYASVVDEKLAKATLPEAPAPRAGSVPLDVAAPALALVQHDIRYVSLAFGEGSIIPHDPNDVQARRYGDCKDQSTLLVGLLRARGLPAHVALLKAGGFGDLEPSLPALSAFDHAIVYVEGNPGFFIDPTSPYHRPGELPRADQDRWALVCKKGTASLVRTPLAPPEKNCEVLKADVHLSPFGPGSLVETVESLGDFEVNRRQRLDDVTPEGLNESYERYLTASYGKLSVDRVVISPTRDLTTSFRSEVAAKKAMAVFTSDSQAEFAFRRSAVFSYLPNPGVDDEEEEAPEADAPAKPPKTRRYDYAVHPLRREILYHVVPPAGFVVRELPPPQRYEFGPGSVELAYEKQADGAVDVRLVASLSGTRLTPAELTRLAKAREAVGDEDVVTISFAHHAQQLAESGHGKEAIEILRGEAAASPKASDPHRRLASVLLDLGFGEAARREAELATKLEPGNARAWHRYGMVLQRDLIGRLRRPGWDSAGAEKALRKATELDAENLEYAADLGILFEFDADGLRYENTKRLERAIDVYKPLLKRLAPDSVLLKNYKIALFRAGRFDELASFYEKKEPKDASGLRMAALIAKSGVADGLREVRRLVPDVSARRAPLNEAASTLVLVRKYEQAAAVLAEAAKGSPDAATLTARAGVLRKMHRFEDAPVTGPVDDPASAVRRLLAVALDPKTSAEALERFVVKVNRRSFEAASFRKGFRGVFVSSSRQNGLPFDFYRDFVQSSVDVAVDGDAAKGWKVRYSFDGAPQTRGTTFFMALEEGEARFVAEAEERADVCRYAYELAKKGDVEGAKRWLDRALDAGGRALDESRPLAGPLLPRFWPSKSAPDRAALSLAAAAGILGAGKLDDDLYKDTRAALLPNDRSHGILMLRALQRREEWKELLEKLTPYQEGEKSVEDWDAAAIAALTQLKRYDEAIALGKAHLASHPDHFLIKRMLASVFVAKGAFDDARNVAEEIAKSPEATAEDLNQAAWFALVAGKADEASATEALQGVNVSSRKEYPVLHTLAAVYAEISKLDEARSVLMEAIDLEPDQAPGPEDWYVIGRLLESYDLVADAKAAYKKAEREKPSPGSSTFLARKRLEKLGG